MHIHSSVNIVCDALGRLGEKGSAVRFSRICLGDCVVWGFLTQSLSVIVRSALKVEQEPFQRQVYAKNSALESDAQFVGLFYEDRAPFPCSSGQAAL